MLIGTTETTERVISIEQVAQVVFDDTRTFGGRVRLAIEDCECSKDLFCFSVELMVHGLVTLFGAAPFDALSRADFGRVANLMQRTGIQPLMRTERYETGTGTREYGLDTTLARDAPDDLPLESYNVCVRTADATHTISFRLLREPSPVR